MTGSHVAKAAVVTALLSFAPMEARAMETFGAPRSARSVNDGLIAIAVHARVWVRGGRKAQWSRPANRTLQVGPRARARVEVNRNVHVSGFSPSKPEPVPAAKPPAAIGGSWARPGWYHWSPGGAIAAGAAIGFVTAATAIWATPPRSGLCWYYTDPTQQDGFWDDCP
jgi:hypothetical protein